jgi:hypothetical protein
MVVKIAIGVFGIEHYAIAIEDYQFKFRHSPLLNLKFFLSYLFDTLASESILQKIQAVGVFFSERATVLSRVAPLSKFSFITLKTAPVVMDISG